MSSTLTFHHIALDPVINGLKNAHALLTKAEAHIKDKGDNADDYLNARLYPDMFHLILQVQRFTDTAKSIATRANPKNSEFVQKDEEKTFPELLERITRTIEYLEGVDPKSFEGREDVQITAQFAGGRIEVDYSVSEYIVMFAHPNFWFHVTTAYDILRSKGVPFAKFDYLNGAGFKEVRVVKKE